MSPDCVKNLFDAYRFLNEVRQVSQNIKFTFFESAQKKKPETKENKVENEVETR
jgi:hypothetical protein